MSELFHNTYRIESARLKNYDYASDGMYFVTICTRNQRHFFGEIVRGKMQYTEIGLRATECWKDIPKHFPFVDIDEWVIMPDHIHGILFMNHDMGHISNRTDAKYCVSTENTHRTDAKYCVSTENTHRTDAKYCVSTEGNKYWPQSNNLASVIRGFKIGVTKYCRTHTDILDLWQPRFHDHIIRNTPELDRISAYIFNNPLT